MKDLIARDTFIYVGCEIQNNFKKELKSYYQNPSML